MIIVIMFISTKQLYDALNVLTNHDYSTNIIIAYLKRFEFPLLGTFKNYGISETNLTPEYAHIKENKWRNFKIYSNIDLPNMKRISGKYGFKNNINLIFNFILIIFNSYILKIH